MSLPILLPEGRAGEATAIDGERIDLVSPCAFAPGAPIRFSIRHGDVEDEISAKTIGCKRRDDGRFDVRARLISLRRAERERLRTALEA